MTEYVETRTEVQVICVSEYDLSLYLLFQLAEMNAFNRTACAYWHEDRCLYLSVVSAYHTGTGIAVRISML